MFETLLSDILGKDHHCTISESQFIELLPVMLKNTEKTANRATRMSIERTISFLELRYGLSGCLARSQAKVALAHDISRERVVQIIAKTLRRLRHPQNRALLFSA